MTFDEQVAALRGCVVPKHTNKKKSDCTPKEWAAYLEYKKPRNNAWQKSNHDKVIATNNKWAASNPDKVAAIRKRANEKWKKANAEKYLSYQRSYWKQRYKHDPDYRMICSLRARQSEFFKGKDRSLSMVRDMGCTQQFFRQHIISKLSAGMTMENYGTVWHLDHIYPLSKAGIVENPIHFLAAANWRNLQPLPGPENLEKSDEVTPEAQSLFDSLVKEFGQRSPSE